MAVSGIGLPGTRAVPGHSGAIAGNWMSRADRHARRLGDVLLRHQRAVRAAQWIIVGVYLLLLVVPALLPLPDRTAHILGNVTVFAQFAFWGIWWPFVLVSMI